MIYSYAINPFEHLKSSRTFLHKRISKQSIFKFIQHIIKEVQFSYLSYKFIFVFSLINLLNNKGFPNLHVRWTKENPASSTGWSMLNPLFIIFSISRMLSEWRYSIIYAWSFINCWCCCFNWVFFFSCSSLSCNN